MAAISRQRTYNRHYNYLKFSLIIINIGHDSNIMYNFKDAFNFFLPLAT